LRQLGRSDDRCSFGSPEYGKPTHLLGGLGRRTLTGVPFPMPIFTMKIFKHCDRDICCVDTAYGVARREKRDMQSRGLFLGIQQLHRSAD
jgi:hypothetical protein